MNNIKNKISALAAFRVIMYDGYRTSANPIFLKYNKECLQVEKDLIRLQNIDNILKELVLKFEAKEDLTNVIEQLKNLNN